MLWFKKNFLFLGKFVKEMFDAISANGKRLCEGGAKKFKTFYKFFPEQKPFSFFQNYEKIKNEMVFCD